MSRNDIAEAPTIATLRNNVVVNRWTFWEGGVNVACFLSGPALPQARRGTVWPGLAHVSDWYLLLRFSFQSSDNTKDMHWSQVLDSVCWCGGW